MSDKSQTVIVPVLVSGYINYANAEYKTFGNKSSTVTTTRAYFAQSPGADASSASLEDGPIQHDIFESIRSAPYGAGGDPYRSTDERSGIYLHWSLPKFLRTGIVGSETSDKSVNQGMKEGGFPSQKYYPPSDYGTPFYRHLPETWIIHRQVEVGNFGNLQVQTLNDVGSYIMGDWKDASGAAATACKDVFVVTPTIVRTPETMDPSEDVEVTCTPLALPNKGPSYLGGSTTLADYLGMGHAPTESITLTPATTSSPFFLDYQPQNAGVFSFFDNLRSTSGTPGQFCNVNVSYTIGGFYSWTNALDPLFLFDPFAQPLASIPSSIGAPTNQTRRDRVRACFLDLDNQGIPQEDLAALEWTDAARMRTLCHGRWLNVPWLSIDNTVIPDLVNPADEVQSLFLNSHPLAVGTNVIDSFYAWLDTQKSDFKGNDPLDIVKKQLLKLQSLVLDFNDDIDSQLQAQDLLSTNNFIPSDQGTIWQFEPSNTSTISPIIPTSTDMSLFSKLNTDQAFLNSLKRQRKHLNSQLFGQWWTYASDRNGGASITECKAEITRLVSLIQANISAVNIVTSRISNDMPSSAVKSALEPAFYTQRDPTIMIAGCKNAWPIEGNVTARIPVQTGGEGKYHQDLLMKNKVPEAQQPCFDLNSVFNGLIQEDLYYLRSGNTPAVPHWYSTDNRDKFTGENGWFPLFIEWEVEYYHIPFDKWELAPQGPEARYGYRLKSRAGGISSVPDIEDDYRIIEGRTPIVPQASGAIKTAITQVFNKLHPDDLNNVLSESDRDSLLSQLDAFDFLSTPLSGFTAQLITLMQGAHLTPVDYSNPKSPILLGGATAAQINKDLGLTASTLALMESNVDFTPFASLVDIPADRSLYSPFKPCAHGQFRFKKFNIIDKFGQVVQGIRPATDIRNSAALGNSAIFPALGDSYSLGTTGDGLIADAVIQRQDSLCSFVQLPPSINQAARINAAFVVPDLNTYSTGATPYRAINDWENPILGWIVINYPDYSIQVFSVNGQFIGEYSCFNGVLDTRPFPPPTSLLQSLDPLFEELCDRFETPGYIGGIFATISRTLDTMKASPSEYSQSMLSVVGKPLALVRFGFSLELGDLPFQNRSSIAPAESVRTSSSINKSILDYEFDIKIGDKDNTFDGLYGYFPINDLSKFYSYHDPSSISSSSPVIKSDPSLPIPPVKVSPFFIDPSPIVASSIPAEWQSHEYAAQVNSHLKVFAGLVNPHAPIHIYSALLPIKQLSLPPWAISQGLAHITSFFKVGPIITPSIPASVPASVIDTNWARTGNGDLTKLTPAGNIAIPAFNLGDWAMLQPFDYKNKDGTQYYVNNVVAPPTKPTWDPAPYSAVEGYLQMKTPLQKPDTGS